MNKQINVRSRALRARDVGLALVRAMHGYGAPVHRLEATYDHVCEGLAVEGVLLAEPTSLVAIVEELGEQRLRVARMGPSGFDLGRWTAVEEVAQALGCGEIGLEAAQVALSEVAERPAPYPGFVVLLAQGIVSGTAVGFLGGGWPEVVAAALIGWLVGVMAGVVRRAPSWSGVFRGCCSVRGGLCGCRGAPVARVWLGGGGDDGGSDRPRPWVYVDGGDDGGRDAPSFEWDGAVGVGDRHVSGAGIWGRHWGTSRCGVGW